MITRWTFIERAIHPDRKNPRGLFQCQCGTRRVVVMSHVRHGKSKSCGCLNLEKATKHGMYGTPEYSSWRSMVKRCTYKGDKEYERYGGSGISVCEEWLNSFDAFFRHVGNRPDGSTLDRIDNNLGYVPNNVRWASRKEQSLNRSCTVWVSDGEETLCIADMARKHHVGRRTISRWLTLGKMKKARD